MWENKFRISFDNKPSPYFNQRIKYLNMHVPYYKLDSIGHNHNKLMVLSNKCSKSNNNRWTNILYVIYTFEFY